ncbi:MAG: hypothetical protein R3191_00765 [Anaerolineales bacterium]|nr:hypothetical protein [Anaerolineales bacterium]
MGNTLAVDLASRRYRDFGFALRREGDPTVELPTPEDIGLEDPPEADTFAAALADYARAEGIDVLLLDGPQGWRHPDSPIEHMRLCERVLNTPGKTGNPGHAKPGTYLNYIQFSIDTFHHLRSDHGWSLVTEDWAAETSTQWAVEVYPSAAWSLLGLDRIPGKSRGEDLEPWREALARVTGYVLPKDMTHDELQAAVVLPLGNAINKRREDLVVLAGVDPFVQDGLVFEGLIASPRLTAP